MKRLYLCDDARARAFEPFALTRPVSELRVGAELIRCRWERAARTKAYGFIGAPHLDNFDDLNSPPAVRRESTIPAGSIIANSRFAIALDALVDDTSPAFSCGDEVCAVRVHKSVDMAGFADGSLALDRLVAPDAVATPIGGRWLRAVWDLVGDLSAQLVDDIPLLGSALSGAAVENATIIGRHQVYCETGVAIEPFVVLDASDGPILIRRGATIASFSRIVGPCYIGEDTHIIGDAIRGCSIGNVCKIRGEISSTVVIGHSNKGHTGFVGSSYVGKWVNLGAGTTTSNLKNTYGTVQIQSPQATVDTGLQFLGALIGDHAKTGIGTMLTTGCVIGAGANFYGGATSPKRIPPFAWGEGEPYARFELDKFLQVAERMMSRRHITLSEKAKRQLEDAHRVSGGQE